MNVPDGTQSVEEIANAPAARSAPKGVVFDLDGLMFNTEELYIDVGHELMRRRDRDFSRELLDAMMGRPSAVAYQTMIAWHKLTDTPEILAAEAALIFDGILDHRLQPMPGMVDLLLALETAGLPKAIATSSRRPFVTRVLASGQFEPRFSFVLTADDVTEGKPHPEIYQKAAARLGLEAREVLVLEDSQTGCRSAAAAGAFVVAVPGPHSRQHDFSMANLVIDTLADPRLYDALRISAPTPHDSMRSKSHAK